jgi:hypothetical protein
MLFPKNDALKMGFKTQAEAIEWATRKRKFGGCFEQIDNLFVCYWLPKGHQDISNFAW